MSMWPRYVIDPRTGRLLPAEKFLNRERKGWKGTFLTFFGELEQTVGQFAKECEDFASDFKPKKKK